jgi:hypothetical protein
MYFLWVSPMDKLPSLSYHGGLILFFLKKIFFYKDGGLLNGELCWNKMGLT